MNYLYFAPNKERTAFKMGFSITPDIRLDTVVGDINYDKTYLFECDDAHATERFCHQYFKDFNVKIYEGDGATEWFDISIFKVALKKVIRHAELLGIVNHYKFMNRFTPIVKCKMPNYQAAEGLIEFDDVIPPDPCVNLAHRTNYKNLHYLVEHMLDFDWTYLGTNTYELKFGRDEYKVIDDLLTHNKYSRDSGRTYGYFNVHWRSKRTYTSHIVIKWTTVNSKTILKSSPTDLRLDCMVGMLEDLHSQQLDSTFFD